MYKYQNYHKHTFYTNPLIADSIASNEDYAKRAAELGHGIISIMEHGWQGRYIEGFELAQKYGLKFVSGVEAYWVKDRTEKDKTNCHIYLGARNERGRRAMNDILAEANITGFYGRPRVDIPLLLSLNPDDFIVTSACLAYWYYDDADEITLQLRDHFKENFFLEVQYHNTEKQMAVNEHIMELKSKYGMPLIMGCDSHYIDPSGAGERADYILSKGISYPDEQGFILDYPGGDEAYRRFANQGVLSHQDIMEAMNNTNVFLEVEDYDCACFTKDIKMPSIHPDWTQEQKDAAYDKLIWDAWNIEKDNIEPEKWPLYEDEIRKETDIVHQTFHADYFIDDHAIVKRGKELGGVLTKTGRGCFAAGAKISVPCGTKPIEDIVTGDIVIDMYGTWRRVINTAKYHINEPCVKICYDHEWAIEHPSICTKDHKIYVERNGFCQWVAAENLREGDYLLYPCKRRYARIPLVGIEEIPAQERDVYDLEVEESHSFVLNGIVVHNSAVSFYTNKLLGLTDVDRIAAKVKMYPERFMSATRILETGSIADVDMNTNNREPFLQAQKEIMGEESSYEMVVYGTLKPKAAWKMYAKSQNIDFALANEVSTQLEKYDNALKHASEDEVDLIDVMDYVSVQYHEVFEQSKSYQGIVSHLTPHPCATLLYQGNIRQEIGLIRVKDKICCVMDGLWAEQYHFLKNDWLKVSVVDLIDRVYKRIGIPQHSEKELLALCPPDSPVWDKVYGRSCTLGINQVEQPGTSHRVAAYKPRNISELCAFVAAIRPGFKSMYKTFEERQPFDYGIPSIDNLIQTDEMPDSFMLYQEMAMAVLNYAGIPMGECYGIIKNIAKKRVQKVLAYKEQFTDGFVKTIVEQECRTEEEAKEVAHSVWQILEDSSRYSFNSSHSYCVAEDSLYGAYLKTNYPLEFYESFLRLLSEKGSKDRMAAVKEEAENYFGIRFPPYQFGQDNRDFVLDHSTNSIQNALPAIKNVSQKFADDLHECGQLHLNKFMLVLKWLAERGYHKATVMPLIKIDYFRQYGNVVELLRIQELFDFFKEGAAKSVSKEKLSDPRMYDLVARHATGTTKAGKEAKSFTITDMAGLLDEVEQLVLSAGFKDLDTQTKMQVQQEILGYVELTTNKEEDRRKLLIMDIYPLVSKRTGEAWAYAVATRSVGSGKTSRLTVRTNVFHWTPFKKGDFIYARQVGKERGYWYLYDYDIVPG